MLYRTGLMMLMAVVITACGSHLSKNQCLLSNWGELGYSDGANGLLMRNLEQDSKDCARFNMGIDAMAYRSAWKQGVRTFCVPQTGYHLGLDGKKYNSVCPEDLFPAFIRQYKRGLRRYCTPETAYQLGRVGKTMPTFCATDLKVAFSNAYQQGHRKYTTLQDIKHQIANIESEEWKNKRDIERNDDEMSTLKRQLAEGHDRWGQSLDKQQRRMTRDNIKACRDKRHYLSKTSRQLTRQKLVLQTQLNELSLS